ncbi:MAG: undecaprenyl-diphosphate phosphatase, partial [Bacteroidota bacterium]
MSIWEALILGIIQGLTEFLPVSSSGHLELAKAIFGVETEENLLFSLVLHLGTALSTVVIFRKYIVEVLGGLVKKPMNPSWDFSLKVVLSMLPALVVGLVFKDQIDSLFESNILLVSLMLLVTGILLTLTWQVRNREGTEVSWSRALLMGIAQAIAILPGISRSGATIATGILSGASKEKATQFSFLMVLPVILGASLLELKDYFEAPAGSHSIGIGVLVAGFITS